MQWVHPKALELVMRLPHNKHFFQSVAFIGKIFSKLVGKMREKNFFLSSELWILFCGRCIHVIFFAQFCSSKVVIEDWTAESNPFVPETSMTICCLCNIWWRTKCPHYAVHIPIFAKISGISPPKKIWVIYILKKLLALNMVVGQQIFRIWFFFANRGRWITKTSII